MATIAQYSVSYNSFSVYVTGLDGNYSSSNRYIAWYVNGSFAGNSPTISAYATQSPIFSYSGCTPNTQYYIEAKCYYYSGGTLTFGWASALYVYTTSPPRPALFYWTYTKTSRGTFNLKAFEWNNLTANINAIRSYKGYSAYNFTTAYQNNTFYYYMFNEAVYVIQGIPGYGSYLTTVSHDGIVYAAALNSIVSELNAIY